MTGASPVMTTGWQRERTAIAEAPHQCFNQGE